MKYLIPVTLAAVFFCTPFFANAQKNDTTYFDEICRKVYYMSSDYYRVVFPREDGRNKVEERYIVRNRLKLTGYYTSVDFNKKEGPFIWYTKKGFKSASGSYKSNQMSGIWKHYFPDTDTLWYVQDFATPNDYQLTSYYRDGKLKRQQTVKNKIAEGKCYDENGKEIAFTPFEAMPRPSVDLNRFLSENLIYPAKAKEANQQGRVVLSFVVDESGIIDQIKVHQSAGKELDDEAIRVLRKMPAWQPGVQDDVRVKVSYSLPLSFKLEG